MPFPLIIPGVIVLIFVPLIINLILKFKALDLLTVVINVPLLYIFVNILIPNQEHQVKYKFNDPSIANNFEVNKYWHLVILPILVLSVFMQLWARCSCGESGECVDEEMKGDSKGKGKVKGN